MLQEVLRRLEAQEAQLKAQHIEIQRQRLEIERLRRLQDDEVELIRGAGAGPGPQDARPPASAQRSALEGPVGEAPPEPSVPVVLDALPEGVGLLTGTDHVVIEATADYSRASTNRLVFRGVELAPGVPLGTFEASDVDRDAASFTLAARTGLTRRLEIEARVPYVWRQDRLEFAAQADETVSRIDTIVGGGLGDVEAVLRYQLNTRPRRNTPFAVATLRAKSDTGRGAFEVERDEAGVARELPTGTGFWGVEPGANFILPSEDGVIVLFGGASYLFHFARDVDRLQGEAFIGRVDPGDSFAFNLGFGFAVNSQFSYSIGYRHNVIFGTDTEINGLVQRSDMLQVGAVSIGGSYRLSRSVILNSSVDIGVTNDTPGVRLAFRVPFWIAR